MYLYENYQEIQICVLRDFCLCPYMMKDDVLNKFLSKSAINIGSFFREIGGCSARGDMLGE